MNCQNCGMELPNDARFCSQCGEILKSGWTTPNPPRDVDWEEREPSFIPVQEDEIIASESGTAADSSSSEFDEWWGKRSKLEKGLVISGIVVCCCILLFLVGMIILKFAIPLIILGIVLGCLVGSEESKAGMRRFVLKYSIIIVIVAIVGVFLLANPDFIPNLVEPGWSVRNACLTQYSEEVTVEEAFDNFFDNGRWSTYKENGYSYVVFNGTCMYDGEPADARITFIITGEHFRMDSIDINGISVGDLFGSLLLDRIYADY